jgi:hypothetical protein
MANFNDMDLPGFSLGNAPIVARIAMEGLRSEHSPQRIQK